MNQITASLVLLLVTAGPRESYSFNTASTSCRIADRQHLLKTKIPTTLKKFETINHISVLLHQSSSGSSGNDINDEPEIGFARTTTTSTTVDNNEESSTNEKKDEGGTGTGAAATNTINERLLAELQDAEQKQRFGPKSALGKKLGSVDGYGRSRKSDEEIKMAIAEARDLNGVNPIVAIGGSFFAFAVAAALWYATNQLGSYFVSHPPATDVYFVIRSAQVFRNVVMGLISLAAGFFGVCGLGIFGMGIRVAYGIFNGELDPTPIVSLSKPKETVDMSKMMDLMMNKKPGRRGGGKK
ncbi:MAG: hypothetical protein ACI8RD_014158 [Bacillariaceae sp.]|jgi:hypothetical protein